MKKLLSRLAIQALAGLAVTGVCSVEADAASVWQNCTITNIGQMNLGTTPTQHVKCVEKLSGTTTVDQYHIATSSSDAARFMQVALAAKLAGKVLVVAADNSTPTTGVCANSTICRVPTAWYFN